MNVMEMGTLPRHNHIAMSLSYSVFDLFKKKKLYPLQENCMLCFQGKRYSGNESLIDTDMIENKEVYIYEYINKLDFVQPDFLFFAKNPFLQNESTSKTIGIPDLVVEIWSESNSVAERDFKKRLYATSDKCEFWEIVQETGKVSAYCGKKFSWEDSLVNVLYTKNGLTFDLRHLM